VGRIGRHSTLTLNRENINSALGSVRLPADENVDKVEPKQLGTNRVDNADRSISHVSQPIFVASKDFKMDSQPDHPLISQDEMPAEVNSIYNDLVIAEHKCIEAHLMKAQLVREAPEGVLPKLSKKYKVLISFGRTLLNQHYQFLAAVQHPSRTPAIRQLPAKYDIPARLYRHGIYDFVELFMVRLPESFDYMLWYIYLAYPMMLLILETALNFKDI
jgi:hypothetical protein